MRERTLKPMDSKNKVTEESGSPFHMRFTAELELSDCQSQPLLVLGKVNSM